MVGGRCRARSARLSISKQSALRLDDVLAAASLRERRTYRGGDCADLRDILAAGGAVGGVCVADEEGLGDLVAGVAVYRIYGGSVVRTAGGSDAAVPRGAAGGAAAELADSRVHDRADVRSGSCGGDLFVRAGVYAEGPSAPRGLCSGRRAEHGCHAGDCCVCRRGAGGWRGGGGIRARYGGTGLEVRGGEHLFEDPGISRWVECAVVAAGLRRRGAAFAWRCGE